MGSASKNVIVLSQPLSSANTAWIFRLNGRIGTTMAEASKQNAQLF